MLACPARECIGFVVTDVTDRKFLVDRRQSIKPKNVPFSADFTPISWRRPGLRCNRGPAIGQPQFRTRIAVIAHECELLAVGDEIAGEPHRADKSAMRRRFIIEAESLALVPDRMNAFGQFAPVVAARGTLRP